MTIEEKIKELEAENIYIEHLGDGPFNDFYRVIFKYPDIDEKINFPVMDTVLENHPDEVIKQLRRIYAQYEAYRSGKETPD